jgi:NADPH-dependent ferric siderophore reductase
MIDELDEVREHLNADHADTVGLIGRFLGGIQTAAAVAVGGGGASAVIDRVDLDGIAVAVANTGADVGHQTFRHPFAEPCATIDQVRVEFFSLLNAAREWAGDTVPLTSLERELFGNEFTTFISEVAAVVDITPTLRQITFRGGLDDFESLGGDEFLYVLLPPRGRDELTVDVDFNWQQYEEMPEAERPEGAYYSVRAWRPVERELDMWFVLHGDEGASSAWAMRAEPGQPVALWGPRRAFDPPEATGSYLLVTDETGFGAVCAVIDDVLAVDAAAVVTVIAEVDGTENRIEFPAGANVSVAWFDREGAPPGGRPLLVDAVSDLDIPADVYAFGAGESRRITHVRKYLRQVIELSAEQVSMTGYWRAE